MTEQIMAPTDQCYWGVSGVLLFGILAALALGVFSYLISRRLRAIAPGTPEIRFDRLGTRIWLTIKYALLQWRMFKDPYAGIMHILIFSGFVLLTVRTAALIVEGFVPGFEVFTGRFTHAFRFAKDVVELFVLVGVAMAAYRRTIARPKRLSFTLDAWVILFLIDLLIVTDLLADASRIALNPSRGGWWSPGEQVAALALTHPFAAPTLHRLFAWCWWVHLIDIFFIANYLPYSKHFHVLTAIPNIFAQKLNPMRQLPGINLEEAEKFGASKVEDFSWKALFDGYACTE